MAMISKEDIRIARSCSEGLQKLYDLSHEWYRLHGLQLPWIAYFRDQIMRIHTELDAFVTAWSTESPNDDAHSVNVSGLGHTNGNRF